MKRPVGVLCLFVVGCTSSAPSEEPAKKTVDDKQAAVDAKQQQIDEAEAAKKKAEAEAAKVKEEIEKAKAEAEKDRELRLRALGGTPVFVILDRQGSRTTKPVPNSVLAHSWGWASASEADRTACEAKATSPGEMMACGSEQKPKGADELIAKLELPGSKSVFVTPEQIAGWNIAAPTSPVWLFGPTQACKATVGRPMVAWYSIMADGDEGGEGDESEGDAEYEAPDLSDDFNVLEVAWELTGCDAADESWAPIGLAEAAPDPTTRWVPMKAGERQSFDPANWTGVLASEVAKLPELAKPNVEEGETVTSKPEWWTQTFELPGTEIRDIYFAAIWRGPEGSKAPEEYGCLDYEFVQVFQMRQAASGASVIGRGSRGHLVGALVVGREVQSMVWTDTLDYQVAKLGPEGLGDSVDLSTGVYHPESSGDSNYTLLPYCGP